MTWTRWQRMRAQWFAQPKADMLAGTVVALALIPEAIAFSIIAGVDPAVGLYASFIIAVVTAFFGGRPGMISAATGAMALLMVDLVAKHGLEYLFATTIVTGVLQFVFRMLRLSRYMKFVPHAVMTGFVNALAILIFMAQLPQFQGAGPALPILVAAGLAIIYGLPLLTKALPAPLVAIVALTAATMFFGVETRTVGDMGALPITPPVFHLPQVPLSLATLRIVLSYAVPLAFVGLLESLLTAAVVDDLTDTPSCKHNEAQGQGIANIIVGFFGGMAGCAMIGQSVINVRSGGRGRLSTLVAGVVLLALILLARSWVARIPMGALVAVMIMVSLSTFEWSSVRALGRMPKNESIVMLSTVAIVVLSHNLALGVAAGVLLSAVFFARKVAKLARVESMLHDGGQRRVYHVYGEIFFVSVEGLLAAFDFQEPVAHIDIDLSEAHVWDASAVVALEKVVSKYRAQGVHVRLIGVNRESRALVQRLQPKHGRGLLAGALQAS
ncbi:MAG: SulP family inorganic anion transporter [Polyangiales bacterium]